MYNFLGGISLNYRKLSSLSLASLLIISLLVHSISADAYSVITTSQSQQTLSKGVTQKNITYLTTEGFINVNVLYIDLNDSNTSISTIFNPSGFKDRMNVEDMANGNGAIAAVNGDFFDTKQGFIIGASVKNGNLLTVPYYKGNYATFAIDKYNNPSIGYWKSTSLNITLPDGSQIPISALNNIGSLSNGTSCVIFTKDWNSNTPGVSDNYKDLVEIIVDNNNKVVDIRKGEGPTLIPDGGYSIDVTGNVASTLLNLKPGDTVIKNISTDPPFNNFKMAVSGGTILVSNGSIPQQFTDNVDGIYARTAIGYTQDKKHVIIATVDNANTRGMTEKELAQLMINLGAYEAMNLDGGGSTQMAVRELGDGQAKLQNTVPGYERNVANGVGVFNTAPAGNLYALKLEADSTNVFVGTHRAITVKGYDENYQPVKIDQNNVSFSINGIAGKFDGNEFLAESAGDGVITARVGNVTGTLKIKALDTLADIRFNPYSLNINKGSTTSIYVTGKDLNGYRAPIEDRDINWTVYNNVGTINNGVFTASNADVSGALSANINGKVGNLLVKVGQGSDFDASQLPKPLDFVSLDSRNKEINVSNTNDSFKFMVFGDTDYDTLLRLQISLKAADTANKDYPLIIFTGDVNDRVLKSLNIQYIKAGDSYGVYDFRNSTFITLDDTKGGLLSSNKDQWSWFLNVLNNVKGDNLFIVLPKPVWGSDGFKDTREAQLFEDTLQKFRENTGKNVWIIYNGSAPFYTTLNDNIRYISNYGTNYGGGKMDIYTDARYISIMVNGKNIYYQDKNLFTK
jgi:exopolysaccharide biosynthesis protein